MEAMILGKINGRRMCLKRNNEKQRSHRHWESKREMLYNKKNLPLKERRVKMWPVCEMWNLVGFIEFGSDLDMGPTNDSRVDPSKSSNL
jgi:hypothetical protein